ncbi:MAG: dipeptidase [Gammaproteobacteria bacterium]|nr:MAG: dipeptidase [Gammaproteobacteria bacterium]
MSIESKSWEASNQAKQFVKNNIVLDFIAGPWGLGWLEEPQLHEYFGRAIETGITGASITLAFGDNRLSNLINEHRIWRRVISEQPEKYRFIHSADDIRIAQEKNQYAIIWNSQSAEVLDGNPENMLTLRELGVGTMLLAYNDRYRAADGCIIPLHKEDGGLSAYGKEIIDAMHKYGMVLDLSHCSEKTCLDATAYTQEKWAGKPVVYTHSVPRGLHPECYRNISDEQIKACAATGGVICPTFTEWMLDPIFPDDIEPIHCANLIDYVVQLVGIDHCGIASDDMFTTSAVEGLARSKPDIYNDNGFMFAAFDKGAAGCGEFAKIIPAFVDCLFEKGYSEEDVAKVLGGNMMRVFDQVWI